MKISVVIPVWNRIESLQRAITSVQLQSFRPHEVIVVDDGSTDGSGEMVAEKFPGVILMSQSNKGVSAARNLGINRASGDWIALLDSDDEWLIEKLAAQVKLLSRNPALKICHTDEIWIRNGIRVNPMRKHAKPEGWIYHDSLPLCCVSPSSIVLHRGVLDHVGLFDETLPVCEDYDLWLRIFCRFEAGLIGTPLLIKNGGHPDQLSRRYWGMDRFRVKALDKILGSDILDSAQRDASIAELHKKCLILEKGFAKRDNRKQADYYKNLSARWHLRPLQC